MATLNDYKNYIPTDLLELIEAAQIYAETKILLGGGTGSIIIEEHDGGGDTNGLTVQISLTTGPGIIPINDAISGYEYRTFLQYDKYTALTHELSHVVLNYLGGFQRGQEIDVAILAKAFDTAKESLQSYTARDDYKLLIAYTVKKLLTGTVSYEKRCQAPFQIWRTQRTIPNPSTLVSH